MSAEFTESLKILSFIPSGKH